MHQDDDNKSDFSALINLGRSLAAASSASALSVPAAVSTTAAAYKVHMLCIITLMRILDNILVDANTPPEKRNVRIRKIKTTGPFYDRAGKWDGSIDFLLECGFERTTDIQLKIVNENPSTLLLGRKALVRFAVEKLGLRESNLPECPALDVTVVTTIQGVSTEDAKLGIEGVMNADDAVNANAFQCADGISGGEGCDTKCPPLEGTKKSVGGIEVISSFSNYETEEIKNDCVGQQIIQPSKDEIEPSSQEQHQQLCQHQQLDEQLPLKQLPQEPATQTTQEDIPSQPISSSDSMSSLLEEIEMELNSESSFFLSDNTSEHNHDKIAGEEDATSSLPYISGHFPQVNDFTASERFLDKFSQPRTPMENEDTLPSWLEDKVPLVDISNRVRLEQTKHVEVEDDVKDISINESISDDNDNIEAKTNRIVPITINDHDELELPEMVEELLLMHSPNENTPQSAGCGGPDEFCTTIETTAINDVTIDITNSHGRTNSASDLLAELESEDEMINELHNTVTSPSLHVQQEHTSEDVLNGNHQLLDKMPEVDMDSGEQQIPDCDKLPDDGADPTLLPPPTITSPSDDDVSQYDYINMFNRISLPKGGFCTTYDNNDIMQYHRGFELCHRALFSVWHDMPLEARKHTTRDRSNYTNPCIGLTNLVLHKRKEVDKESANERQSSLPLASSDLPSVLVPLEIAYASWACILQLNSDDCPSISSDSAAAGKMYSWIVSNNRQLSIIDDNIPPSQDSILSKHVDICNFVCKSMRNIGLISLYSANIVGGASEESTLYIGIREGFQCDESMPLERDGTIPKLDDRTLLSKCHDVLAQLLYPKIIDELDLFNKYDVCRESTNHDVICWYSCRFAVKHLIESGQLMIAKALLSETRFIQLRIQYMGCLAGTYAHCRDCARLYFCLSQSQTNDVPDEDSKLESKVNDTQKHDIAGWTKDHFEILCSISFVLRRKEEELSSSTRLNHSEGNEVKKEIGQAMQMIGEFIGDIGPYRVQEMEHYEEAFRLLSESHRDDQNHTSIADILYVMGCHHQRFNHFNVAQKCYEQSLRMYKITIGSEHQCVAQVLHNIGIIYHAAANNAIALKCFNKSLSIRLSRLSESDLSVADSYCWIGNIHREEKRFSKARENFIVAHRIKVTILGVGHSESAEVLHNIGIVCDDLGLTSQSLSCFRKVLFIRLSNVSGANDVSGINDVCETLDCIANVYRAIGENQKALLFLEQCLKRRVRTAYAALPDKEQITLLGRTYEDVIALTKSQAKAHKSNDGQSEKLGTLFVEIGQLYDRHLNKQMRALTNFQSALQIFKEGNFYKQIGSTLSLIGAVHAKKSVYQKALKCFNDSLVIQRMYSQTNATAEIADTLHNIGNCEARLGHFENSLPSFKEALRIKKKIYTAVHLSISKTEHSMGLVLSQLGNLDDAHMLFQSSLSIRKALLGCDHLDVSYSLHSLGKTFSFQDNVDDAISCLEEALEIKKSKLPDKHMSLAETLHLLGSLYIKKGTCAPAIPLLNTALVAYRGRRDCEILKSDALDLLGTAYAKIGDPDNAILSYEHSLKIKRSVVGEETIPCANVLMEIGRLKSLNNDDDGALVAFKEVKTIHKKVYGKNHLKNADLLFQVGLIQERRDNNDLALRCYVESLKIRRKRLEKNHIDIAAAIVCVGRIHQDKSDHVKAITLFQDAIQIYQECDNASYECGTVSRLLGLSQIAIGANESAISSLEFCLNGRARTFGTESKEWAEAAYSLGVAKSEAGLHDDAISLFEEYVLLQKSFGKSDSQSLAYALLSLGKNYVHKRKVENAMACFDEALGYTKQSNDDQGASDVLFQIGSVRESKKQYLESLECYEESLKLRSTAVGEDEVTADIVSRIGELHRIRGHPNLALEKFALALDMYKCAVGETHLSVANTYHSLGYVCDAMDDVPKSMQNHKEGLSVRKLILGGNHVLIASSLDDIAGMYQKQNEHQKALKCLKEALRIRRLQLSDDDIEISKTLFCMGIIFAAINDNENAAECYKTSLEISSRAAESHPKLEAQTLHQIGCLEAAKCNYREALHNWRTCLSKYRESGLRDDHYMVACTLGNIEMAENVLRASESDV